MESSQMEFDEEENYEIFATEIAPKQQNTPEVIAAKQIEYENYVKFDAFLEVKDVGQERLETWRVCSRKEKQDGLKVDHKAKLVIKGSMEKDYPRSNSPNTAKGSFKIFFAVTANEGFDIVNLNIRN